MTSPLDMANGLHAIGIDPPSNIDPFSSPEGNMAGDREWKWEENEMRWKWNENEMKMKWKEKEKRKAKAASSQQAASNTFYQYNHPVHSAPITF